MTDCTVIIPIGPGHMKLAQVATGSVVAAVEAGKGPFDRVYIVAGDDSKGEIGRSRARNKMVRGHEQWMGVFGEDTDVEAAFTSEWLFFLDADDLMCSPSIHGESAFETARPYVEDHDCIWGAIYEMDLKGQIQRRKQVDLITTYEAYVKRPPFLTCQMGHFVRRSAFLEIGAFDEQLDVCEDVDLYLREWKNLRCIKQAKPLFLNRRGAHSWREETPKGARPTYTGRDWSIRAEQMLKEARKQL